MILTNGKLTIDGHPLVIGGAAVAARPEPVPSLPRTLWTAWKAYGHRIATYQTELLLSVVYFLVLGPSGFLARLSGKRLLDLSDTARGSYWIPRTRADKSLAGMQRQY